VKNPYLRATFTKLLRYLVPRSESNQATASHGSQRLAAVFGSHALAKAHLAPALMQFFVDIEFTGAPQPIRYVCVYIVYMYTDRSASQPSSTR